MFVLNKTNKNKHMKKVLILLIAVVSLTAMSCKTSQVQQERDLSDIIATLRATIPGININMLDRKVKVMLDEGVYFQVGSAELNTNALSNLNQMAVVLNKYPRTNIDLNGYTDNTGTRQINEKLSFDRAVSVKKHLQQQNVKGDRIKTFGYADANPAASNDTPEGRQLNRRVEFIIYYP